MKFLKLTKRENDVERCLSAWTPWLTIVWDFGSLQCRGTDELGLVIKRKAWGPVLYFGNRDIEKLGERKKFDRLQFTFPQPRYAEMRKRRIDERNLYEAKEQEVRQEKEKHPCDMTYCERHEATMRVVRKMKFSANFVYMMTTPFAIQQLDRGEQVKDEQGNLILNESGDPVTREDIAKAREAYIPEAFPNGGLLAFKRAKNGEGYETIRVPNAALRKIESGVSPVAQLEDEKEKLEAEA